MAVLNWNGQKLLERFLPSLAEHSAEADIFLVDNASGDDSVVWTQEHHPEVNIIRHEANYGYAGGYNRAVRHIPHSWIVMINSDVQVEAGWLKPLMEEMDKNPQMAAAQPKILDLQFPAKFEYDGAAGGFIDKWGYPFCRGRLFDNLEEDNGQYDQKQEVFWATGACLLVKREPFLLVGGLDEQFFAHMEEIDLCWRLKKAGYKIMALPKSRVWHMGGGTLSHQSSRKTYLNFRNNLYLLYKNLPQPPWRTLLWRMVLDGLAAFQFLAKGEPTFFGAVFKAHIHFYKALPYLKKARSKFKYRDVNHTLTGTYNGSVVWAYFARKQKVFTELRQESFSK